MTATLHTHQSKMANDDISGVVQGLVKEYIVPKNTIYRITFVVSEINYPDDGYEEIFIDTKIKRCLFEIIDKDEIAASFDDDYRINSRLLEEMLNTEHKAVVIHQGNETYTLIKAEKVA